MEDEQDDLDWSGYESGPFCRHWGDPSDCDAQCKACGHLCSQHAYDEGDTYCFVEDCECDEWVEPD